MQFGVGGIHIILKYTVAESWIRILQEKDVPTLAIVMQRGLIWWKEDFKMLIFWQNWEPPQNTSNIKNKDISLE